MVRYRKTDTQTRMLVISLVEQGVSCREISRQLKLNVDTVYRTRKRYKETGSVADKARRGRRKKMTMPQDRALILLDRSDSSLRSHQLRQNMETELGVTVCSSTIRKRLYSARSQVSLWKFERFLSPSNCCNKLQGLAAKRIY